VTVTAFRNEINLRIDQTRRYLAQARQAGDDFLVDVRLGELESLSRLASDHGIVIADPEDSLAE
jgi:hypothetical protein